MRAIAFQRIGELREVELPVPEPGPGEVLLKVHACGVCRTDLHLLDGEVAIDAPPRILGHQIVGTTPDGRRVGVPWLGWTCGTCAYCTSARENLCPNARFTGRDIEATKTPTEVFADDRVTVSSVENTHFPESAKANFPYRAVSYRLDSNDRSITISGDTAYSENLVRLAEGSDVFVCETIEVATARENFERRVAAGAYADNPEGIWEHIVGTHSTTEDAGRMAAEAGVGTLVLSHIIPGSLMDVPDSLYLEGVRKHFDGEVIVGRDLMVI